MLEHGGELVDRRLGCGHPSQDRVTESSAERRKGDQDAVTNRGQRNAGGADRNGDDLAGALKNHSGQLLSSLNGAADQLTGLIDDELNGLFCLVKERLRG